MASRGGATSRAASNFFHRAQVSWTDGRWGDQSNARRYVSPPRHHRRESGQSKPSASLKSTGTTTSFSSELKSASEKETTKAVPGQNYAEILTGPRAGMYLNTSGGARDGEAFVLVKHDGREDHIYGTGKDRKVVTSAADKSEQASTRRDQDLDSTGSGDDRQGARRPRRPSRSRAARYADILTGPRKAST